MGRAEVIVIDTHILLWWFSGDTNRISNTAFEALETERRGGVVLVSSISIWEIAHLQARRRIGLASDVHAFVEVVARVDAITFVPVDNAITIIAAQLDNSFHRDPADRIIIATSLRNTASLVTADEKIRNHPGVRTIW